MSSLHPEACVCPFPDNATRFNVPPTTSFRSTWLASSLRSLRERELFDGYLENLPKEHHAAILTSVAGVWLPAEVATSHYLACDALHLSEAVQLSIGADVAKNAQATVLGTAVRLAKGAGVTPWTVLERFPQLWARIWIGGGVAIYRLGPKDARLEVAGWPCSRIPYAKTAMRGVTGGLIELFCHQVFVSQIDRLCTSTTLGYHFAWV